MYKLDEINILGLVMLLFILPAAPCVLLWLVVAPVTVWQTIAMVIISIGLYVFFGIIELIILAIIAN